MTSFLATETRIVVATSASAACGANSDAGAATKAGRGAVLTLLVPAMSAGTFPIGAGDSAVPIMVSTDNAGVGVRQGGRSVALLTAWKTGVLAFDGQRAASGTVALNLEQPGGGTIGSYDLMFGSDEEQGTFIAPECDICAANP